MVLLWKLLKMWSCATVTYVELSLRYLFPFAVLVTLFLLTF